MHFVPPQQPAGPGQYRPTCTRWPNCNFEADGQAGAGAATTARRHSRARGTPLVCEAQSSWLFSTDIGTTAAQCLRSLSRLGVNVAGAVDYSGQGSFRVHRQGAHHCFAHLLQLWNGNSITVASQTSCGFRGRLRCLASPWGVADRCDAPACPLLKACGLAHRHFCAPVTAKGSNFSPGTHGRMVSGDHRGARYLVAVAGQEAQQCSSDPIVRSCRPARACCKAKA